MKQSHLSALKHRRAALSASIQKSYSKVSNGLTYSGIETQAEELRQQLIRRSDKQSPPSQNDIFAAMDHFLAEEGDTLNDLDFAACLFIFRKSVQDINDIDLRVPHVQKFLALSFLRDNQLVQDILNLTIDKSLPAILAILSRKVFVITVKRLRRVSNISAKSLDINQSNLFNILSLVDCLQFKLQEIQDMLPSLLTCLAFFSSVPSKLELLSQMVLSLIFRHQSEFQLLSGPCQICVTQAIYSVKYSYFPKPLIHFIVHFENIFVHSSEDYPAIYQSLTQTLIKWPSFQLFTLLLSYCELLLSNHWNREPTPPQFADVIDLVRLTIQNPSLFPKESFNFLLAMISFGLHHSSTRYFEDIGSQDIDLIQWFLMRRFQTMINVTESKYQLRMCECLIDCLTCLTKTPKHSQVICQSLNHFHLIAKHTQEWAKDFFDGALFDSIAEFLRLAESREEEGIQAQPSPISI